LSFQDLHLRSICSELGLRSISLELFFCCKNAGKINSSDIDLDPNSGDIDLKWRSWKLKSHLLKSRFGTSGGQPWPTGGLDRGEGWSDFRVAWSAGRRGGVGPQGGLVGLVGWPDLSSIPQGGSFGWGAGGSDRIFSEPRCKSCNAKNNYIHDKNMHHFDFDLWLDIPRRPQAPSNPNCLHE